jgi:hypothetical protein
MKFIALLFSLVIACNGLLGQNLIGHKYDDIRNHLKTNRKDLSFNKVNNTNFNYLKYTDSSDSQTMLFFLDDDSICRSIRIICDASSKSLRIKEFNSIYRKRGETKWIDKQEGKEYLIELTDETWASVFTFSPVK